MFVYIFVYFKKYTSVVKSQRLFQETWVVDFAGCFHKHTVLLQAKYRTIKFLLIVYYTIGIT